MARSTSSNSWEGVVKLAKAAGAAYPELVAAQWALESGWGKHAPGLNYFGLKSGLKGSGQKLQTTEVIDGKRIEVVDGFLVFDSLADCIDYLVSHWYHDYKSYTGVNQASSVEEAARELQKQGYATDPSYADRLIELVRQHAGESHESKPQEVESPVLWLKARQDTWLKKQPVQATELGEMERVQVSAGRVYGVELYQELAADAHVWVELGGQAGAWFVWAPHWEHVQKGVVTPSGARVDWDDFRCLVTPSLSVGEVLQFDKRRIPTSRAVERRILQTAEQFQRIRDAWGQPIGVTSFYRPPAVNAEVGGVLGSRHVDGLAMDVYPIGRSLESFYQWIRVRWSGGLGDGRARGFIHLDRHDGTRGFVPGAGVRPIREWSY